MKNVAWLLLVALTVLVGSPAFAAFPEDFRNQNSTAAPTKTEEVPGELQMRAEYSGADLIYLGKAIAGRATSASAWVIHKYTYASGLPTVKQTAYGAWDDRASLTYA